MERARIKSKATMANGCMKAILICHSERSEESQFVINRDRNSEMFRFAQHDAEFSGSRRASDNSDTNHSENVQSDSTVDDCRAVRAQQFCRLCQKVRKLPAWDVNLSDDEARFFSANYLAEL